jgi:hypothetical protein
MPRNVKVTGHSVYFFGVDFSFGVDVAAGFLLAAGFLADSVVVLLGLLFAAGFAGVFAFSAGFLLAAGLARCLGLITVPTHPNTFLHHLVGRGFSGIPAQNPCIPLGWRNTQQ